MAQPRGLLCPGDVPLQKGLGVLPLPSAPPPKAPRVPSSVSASSLRSSWCWPPSLPLFSWGQRAWQPAQSQALPGVCSPVLWKGSVFTSHRPPVQSHVHPLHLHLQFRRVGSPLNTSSLSGFPIWRLSSSVTERMQDTQWIPPRGAGKSLFKCVQCLSLGRSGHGALCSQFINHWFTM